MKTAYLNRWRIIAMCAIALLLPSVGMAQSISSKNGYANIDWQFNAAIGNGFAENASGWGMNFEGGYYFTPNLGVGLFLSFHTNNEYIDMQTLKLSSSAALATDQQHSLYQLPFGLGVRYRFMPEKLFVPYVGMKVGPEYCRMTTYYNVYSSDRDIWGFYLSPEIGATIYPMKSKMFGFHVALYYAYATNQNHLLIYNFDGLNNIGFRLGVAF